MLKTEPANVPILALYCTLKYISEGEDCLSDDEMPPGGAFPNQNLSALELEARQNWQAEEARERVEIFSNSETTSGREIDLNKDKLSAIQIAMAKIRYRQDRTYT